MAGAGRPPGRSVSQCRQRSVQTAAAAPLLSPGSLRARRGSLLQPGRQTRPARHHRVSQTCGSTPFKHPGIAVPGQTGVFFSRCSFLLTRYAESLGHFAAASQSCNFSLRFFHSNQKDVRQQHLFLRQQSEPLITDLSVSSSRQTSEYIIQAYKYGAFEKIPEFIALRNRLNHSLHFAQVRTERMLLDLFLEADM